MIEIEVPGYRTLQLEHLVLDYNGTLAADGELIAGSEELLLRLSTTVEIRVVTADTFDKARSRLQSSPCTLTILPPGDQAEAKRKYVQQLGADRTVCVGNGRNDCLMLQEAALGIAVVQQEGAAVEAMLAADVVCPGIIDALDLLLHPLRLKATLRS
jgi:soluble P-type ATPase